MNSTKSFIQAFESIRNQSNSDFIDNMIQLVQKNELYRDNIDQAIKETYTGDYLSSKNTFLDMILEYINLVLEDNHISEEEYKNVKMLKRLFKIEEGDFYNLRFKEIREIILKQLFLIYQDLKADEFELIHKAELQGVFDLSYDQMNEFSIEEAQKAIMFGASLSDLDVFMNPE